MPPSVTLYWLERSRAQRIVWLLEECKCDYEIKTFKRGQDMLAPKSLKQIHPLGKSPIVKIHSEETQAQTNEIILAESGHIVEYLTEHFAPHLQPTQWQSGQEGHVGGETPEWLRYRYFMHYAEGSLMGLLVMALIFGAIKTKSPFLIRPLAALITGAVESSYLSPNLTTHYDFLEEQIKTAPQGGPFICGSNLTGADILLSFPLIASRARGPLTQAKYPRLLQYLELLERQDGYQRATKRIEESEGGYSAAL